MKEKHATLVEFVDYNNNTRNEGKRNNLKDTLVYEGKNAKNAKLVLFHRHNVNYH